MIVYESVVIVQLNLLVHVVFYSDLAYRLTS